MSNDEKQKQLEKVAGLNGATTAFPGPNGDGMTLREYYAGVALPVVIRVSTLTPAAQCEMAVQYADALLFALAKSE